MLNSNQLEVLQVINTYSKEIKSEVYLVGGLLRDILLDLAAPCLDLDLIVLGDAGNLAEQVQTTVGGKVRFFPEFLTAKLVDERFGNIDFTSCRKEVYICPGALPVVTQSDLKSDLARRDFTINALAVKLDDFIFWSKSKSDLINLKTKIVDQFNGLSDLCNREIKILHSKSFVDDPTRIFRAIKYSAKVKGNLSDETEKLLISALLSKVFDTISANRIVTELKKIFQEDYFFECFELLEKYKVLNGIFSISDWTALLLQLKRLSSYNSQISSNDRFSTGLAVLLLNTKVELRLSTMSKLGYSNKKAQTILERIERLETTTNLAEFLDFEVCVLASIKSLPALDKELKNRNLKK